MSPVQVHLCESAISEKQVLLEQQSHGCSMYSLKLVPRIIVLVVISFANVLKFFSISLFVSDCHNSDTREIDITDSSLDNLVRRESWILGVCRQNSCKR